MTQNRFYSSTALPTFLTSPLGSSGNPQVSSITGLPSSFPYTVLIDWGLSTQEAISVTSTPTGAGPFTLPCTRGIDGTTAQAHSQNAVVVHGVSAEDYNEPQVHISTGVSGSGYPNVIHGLANTSAVVGTIDTQTLSNKTLAGATFTGALSISVNSAGGVIENVVNTHSSPTSPNVKWTANAAADLELGIFVAGDTVNRYQIDSNGKISWGAGGSSAVDTDLYRNAAGVLKTDTAFVAGTSVTAASEALSSSQAAGALLVVTNTHSAPSAPNVQHIANAAADAVSGVQVTGDTNFRYTIDSNGKVGWGSGSGATDTDLYRQGAGVLATDQTFGAVLGAQLGANAPSFGAGTGGILGLTNATAAPSAGSIASGLAVFSQTGLLRYMNTNGLSQVITGAALASVGGVTVNNTATETAVVTQSIPAGDPIAGATYTLTAYGILSTPASGGAIPTVNCRWGGTAGTSLALTTPSAAPIASLSAVPIWIFAEVNFITTTSAVAYVTLTFQNSITNTGSTTWTGVSAATVTGLTTNSTQSLVLDFKWASAVVGDTATFYVGQFERLS